MADTPYEKIANAVERWCEEHGYQTMLVSISLHYDGEQPREITEILEFDLSNMTAVWDSDWWEGEQFVEMLGFAPLDNILLRGMPADVREVVLCKDCRHRDPEDHKCDCGGTERQGCPFKVADDYFCAYGER